MKTLFLSRIVGISLLIVPGLAGALAPVEGILLGEAVKEIQVDPLTFVFSNVSDVSPESEPEFRKMKFYQALQKEGRNLVAQCSFYGPSTYTTTNREITAKRTVAAALQYVGLDTSIKAIGAYARKLEMGENEFKTLAQNLVGLYCSENITVFSRKTIQRSLEASFDNPQDVLPTVEASPFVTEAFRNSNLTTEARSRELQLAVQNFRAFCSWGGSPDDYRLLPPYLKNPFVMALVTRNLSGSRFVFSEKEKRMLWTNNDPAATRVSCRDLVCRASTPETFSREFPTSTGSTGIDTDINKLWCQHFRYLDYDQKKTIPEVRAWMKEQELEGPYLETLNFISLITRVPDPLVSQEKFSEIPRIVKSSVDERWTKWARDSLGAFSRDLLFEESLRVKAEPRRTIADVREDLLLDFHVTLGEMDRLLKNKDKIGVVFDLRLSKSYLHSLITRWNTIAQTLDAEGEAKLREDIARYLELQLRTKENLFRQKPWNENFPRLLADELLAQVLSYQGTYFTTSKDEMVTVPVRFSYGIFALSYLRFRNQVAKGATKLNL